MSHDFVEVMKNLFIDQELTQSADGKRLLKPAKRCYKTDIPFLSALYYDLETQRTVKRFISERNINTNREVYFPQFKPWFKHRGLMKFKGLWIKETNTFFATCIQGFEFPDSPEIKNLNPVDSTEKKGTGEEEVGRLNYQIEDPELDINSDEAPDSMAGVASIVAGTMEYYNFPRISRPLSKKERQKKKYDGLIGEEVAEVSTDETDGSRKGVGSSTISIQEGAVYVGTVMKLWKTLLWYEDKFPKVLSSVRYYTMLNGFRSDTKLHVQPLWNKKEAPESIWFELHKQGRARGMMIAELVLTTKLTFYLMSIERKLKRRTSPLEEAESFSGIVFTLKKGSSDINQLTKTVVEKFEDGADRFSYKMFGDSVEYVNTFSHSPCHYMDQKTKETIPFKTLIDRLIRNVSKNKN